MLDTALVGRYLVNAVAASRQMGHVSAAQSMLYMAADTPEAQFVRDALVECLCGDDLEATTRLNALADEMADVIADAVAR